MNEDTRRGKAAETVRFGLRGREIHDKPKTIPSPPTEMRDFKIQ